MAGIDRFAARLRLMMPGVRIGVAHGQMPAGALEDVMMALSLIHISGGTTAADFG